MMQVGDYVDTLMLPSSGLKNATVRWIPGPLDVTGVPCADSCTSEELHYRAIC